MSTKFYDCHSELESPIHPKSKKNKTGLVHLDDSKKMLPSANWGSMDSPKNEMKEASSLA